MRGDQRLQVDDVEQAALGELRLRQRRGDAQDRLVGEEHGALRHGVDVAGEPEAAQTLEQAGGESALARQPFDLGLGERQRLEEVERLLQSCGDEEVALRRQLAHEQLEHGRFVHAPVEVGLHHRELVEIGEEGGHGPVRASSRAAR